MYDRRLRRSVNKAILSTKYPQFAAKLQKIGYDIIPSEEIPCKMPYERDHADLQCLILNDTAFVLSCCERLSEALYDDYHVIRCGRGFSGSYPDNTCLSAVICNDKLVCRDVSIDIEIKNYCQDYSITLIPVNQGYARCSCATIGDNAIITADKGIISALKDTDIDVLPIGKGSIMLDGADCGFIGGASGYDPHTRTVYFCGDINKHPDAKRIKAFCAKHKTNIICLTKDEWIDIGGIIFC